MVKKSYIYPGASLNSLFFVVNSCINSDSNGKR